MTNTTIAAGARQLEFAGADRAAEDSNTVLRLLLQVASETWPEGGGGGNP
jgi:hypothetical protein